MKKSLLLCLLIGIVNAIGHSQDRGYIAVSLGPSFPNGDFGSKDVNNESAGLATTGAIFDITYAQKFGGNFGISILLRGQANAVDNQPLIDELYAELPFVPWSAESGTWGIGGFMGGLYCSFPMSENGKLTFDTRGMIGFLSATSPEITISGYAGNQYFWVTTESASGEAIGYLIGAGFKFGIGKHLGLLLNFDYMGATPEFEDVATYTSLGTIEYNTYQQKFGALNVGVGIGFRW